MLANIFYPIIQYIEWLISLYDIALYKTHENSIISLQNNINYGLRRSDEYLEKVQFALKEEKFSKFRAILEKIVESEMTLEQEILLNDKTLFELSMMEK